MAADHDVEGVAIDASSPLPPGRLLTIAEGALSVDIAPSAGGRIAQVRYAGVEHLVGHDETTTAMIAWGCYPMVPWAGRIRGGRFPFDGRQHRLPTNLGGHAIHGVGFAMAWQVDAHSPRHVELSLRLPEDARWPFGGTARQHVAVGKRWLRMTLSATAGARAMPAVIGWHPWLRKPERVEFAPRAQYPRDDAGIATLPLITPTPGPWDDCFVNDAPVDFHREGRRIRLTSSCTRWVVYDQPAHATCIEPQSGPPDAFNLEPVALLPGQSIEAWFLWEWR